jgi:hypothetical protein
MQRILVLSMSAAAMTWGASAFADSPKLNGTYAFTGSATCNVSANPFDPKLFFPTDGSAWLHSFTVEGVRTFNGDGTGSVQASAMGINFGLMHTNAGSSTFSFDFTYTVNPDRTWTSDMVPGSFKGTETSGGRSGQTFTIDQLPTFYGYISQDGKTLTAATVHSRMASSSPIRPQRKKRPRIRKALPITASVSDRAFSSRDSIGN